MSVAQFQNIRCQQNFISCFKYAVTVFFFSCPHHFFRNHILIHTCYNALHESIPNQIPGIADIIRSNRYIK